MEIHLSGEQAEAVFLALNEYLLGKILDRNLGPSSALMDAYRVIEHAHSGVTKCHAS